MYLLISMWIFCLQIGPRNSDRERFVCHNIVAVRILMSWTFTVKMPSQKIYIFHAHVHDVSLPLLSDLSQWIVVIRVLCMVRQTNMSEPFGWPEQRVGRIHFWHVHCMYYCGFSHAPRGGGGTHILGHGRGSAVMTPVFEIFDPIWSIFYTSTQSDWPPFSAEKNRFVSITFSSRDTRTYSWCIFSPKCII